ncbi:nucleotidyltransferase family protein [Noviherbaspirillum sp.]|uniref:nucleotidyltransferase family protein n=1 Tax=Noviherbaspirillum sp. TaxID=1926288 RepID=UPI002D57C0EC|nr:nucleotidyltransferase family protein [Noviherbaspirillum sp.]HZW22783.1 nucleotidyltransferase family protein [Noviherbaspirillum sp.]
MQQKPSPDTFVGILLAAGSGSRFDASGRRNKLLQTLPGGDEVAVASAKVLLAALPAVIAVIRPGNEQLGVRLKEAGCIVTTCPDAGEGMAASLVHGLREAPAARGWVLALADMPFVRPGTVSVLAEAVEKGATIAAPYVNGRRGNPVAFARVHLDELLALHGDEGARRLLVSHPVTAVEVDDPGILRDIDTPGDLPSPD